MFSKNFCVGMKKLLSNKVTGDIKGDGFQQGGALVVDKGGKSLFEFVQLEASDHISHEDILKSLGLNKN
jgi:prostamide/prostaglandin F2alpha synthase